jgi:hypothetical protein
MTANAEKLQQAERLIEEVHRAQTFKDGELIVERGIA